VFVHAYRSRAERFFAIVGTLVWLFGFGIEVIADRQKKSFRANPANRDRFIQHGLWAWSMHPNYFGKITLWIGVAIVAFPTLSGWQYATLIAPVFVYILLTRISGIPLLTSRGENKWGHAALTTRARLIRYLQPGRCHAAFRRIPRRARGRQRSSIAARQAPGGQRWPSGEVSSVPPRPRR
jgi:steroid 5-alpha reductase family enzyme